MSNVALHPVTVLHGNCIEVMRELAPESAQCIVTSPPYWGLRDYEVPASVWGGDPSCQHKWVEHVQPAANGIIHEGGMTGKSLSINSATRQPKRSDFCALCNAWKGAFGLEPSPNLYVRNLVLIFREARRVLRKDGTLWLNLGDSYATKPIGSGSSFDPKWPNARNRKEGLRANRTNRPEAIGLKHKDLIGIPWRVAFALQADGWWLRSDIIWHKPNPMPESVRDRCTRNHEYIFLLAKSSRYFFDAGAISEPSISYRPGGKTGRNAFRAASHNLRNGTGKANRPGREMRGVGNSQTRNKRGVWTVAVKPYRGAHFATFPPELITPCIAAGSKSGDIVLDPFAGSGTTGDVAVQLGRRAVLIELNSSYLPLIGVRCGIPTEVEAAA